MGDEQNKEAAKTQFEILPPPGSIIWCQTQNDVDQLKFEWTINQFAFLKPFENWGSYRSSEFCHEKITASKWILRLFDDGSNGSIKVNLEVPYPNNPLGNPVRVKIAFSNKKREKIFPQQNCLPQHTRLPYTVFQIEKNLLINSRCLMNGKLTIYCEIETFIPKRPVILLSKLPSEADFDEKPFNNSDQLVAELEELFETMTFSDFTVNIRGRQFQAHKSILATRSKYFAAMFEHPTKENLTNQIEVEDVEPAVFHEILRFIYTGRLSESTMQKMPAEILAVADKYLLDQLKMECETQLIHRMSAENCLELLLITHEHHPAFNLRKYAVEFFRNFSSEVMATDDWKIVEQDDPELFIRMLKELVKSLV